MCFSASASFVAGTSLSAVGVVSIAKTPVRRERLLAAIPLLFGLQQLAEGVVWLTFQHDAPRLRHAMTSVYLGFSHVLWPMYVPVAMGLLESVRWRAWMFVVLSAAGWTVGLYFLWALVTHPVTVDVVGMHLVYYSPPLYRLPVILVYLVVTCLGGFCSSHRFVRLFGVLASVSYAATFFVFRGSVVSVWCFVAAVLSVLIYLHVWARRPAWQAAAL